MKVAREENSCFKIIDLLGTFLLFIHFRPVKRKQKNDDHQKVENHLNVTS